MNREELLKTLNEIYAAIEWFQRNSITQNPAPAESRLFILRWLFAQVLDGTLDGIPSE